MLFYPLCRSLVLLQPTISSACLPTYGTRYCIFYLPDRFILGGRIFRRFLGTSFWPYYEKIREKNHKASATGKFPKNASFLRWSCFSGLSCAHYVHVSARPIPLRPFLPRPSPIVSLLFFSPSRSRSPPPSPSPSPIPRIRVPFY